MANDLTGLKPSTNDLDATLILPKCPLVIHCAAPETWFLRLFETTGSEEHCVGVQHQIWCLEGKWYRGKWINVGSRTVVPKSEGEIYDLVSRRFVPPRKRSE